MGSPTNPHYRAAAARLRAGERPSVVAVSLKVHPQTVYAWRNAECTRKRELIISLIALADQIDAWVGDPTEVSVLLMRRDRLRAGLLELRGNRL